MGRPAVAAAGMPPAGKTYPPHERCVDIHAELGLGGASCTVLGADLSYDYVKENADYRT
mgnify:CR=1 FL=1